MTSPLVSVVIPTCGRPQYLPRAVESALTCQGNAAEVIVVPNGPDQSWKESLAPWRNDSRVRLSPTATAHGNVARNHGMSLARGKYLRFLDDDDYLLPEAYQQVADLEQSGEDLSIGGIEIVTAVGKVMAKRTPPSVNNLVDAILVPNRIVWPHAYLYRRARLGDLRWDEGAALGQDKLWLYGMCVSKEWTAHSTNVVVGVWRQHGATRVTGGIDKRTQSRVSSSMLLDVLSRLDALHWLCDSRKEMAAQQLWKLICGAYYLEPRYWRNLIDAVAELAPRSRPDLLMYRVRVAKRVPPRLVLNVASPLQHLRRWVRILLLRVGIGGATVRP